MSYWHEFFFGYYPYVAGVIFLVGSIWRFERDQFSWRSGSSQMLRQRQLMWGSNLFHIGILLLFLGHLIGLLTPVEVFHAMGVSSSAKQVLAVVAGGVFGVICFIGMTLLVHRRLWDPRIRATSSHMDVIILLLLYVQLILGLITIPVSLGHIEGHNMVLLMEWSQRIVTFQGGAAELVVGVPLLFKLHLVLGVTIFLLFPFSRLVHIWSAPVGYVGRSYQIVRTRRA